MWTFWTTMRFNWQSKNQKGITVSCFLLQCSMQFNVLHLVLKIQCYKIHIFVCILRIHTFSDITQPEEVTEAG